MSSLKAVEKYLICGKHYAFLNNTVGRAKATSLPRDPIIRVCFVWLFGVGEGHQTNALCIVHANVFVLDFLNSVTRTSNHLGNNLHAECLYV